MILNSLLAAIRRVYQKVSNVRLFCLRLIERLSTHVRKTGLQRICEPELFSSFNRVILLRQGHENNVCKKLNSVDLASSDITPEAHFSKYL